MGVFFLKENDTEPILEVTLKNPDETVHDLTGKTVNLNIWLSDDSKITREMTVTNPTGGVVQYTFLATDWGAGKLVVGPTLPLAPGVREHRMEYEAILGSGQLTFPNDGYDTLRIIAEAD